MNWSLTIERYLAEGRTVSGGKGEQKQANSIAQSQLKLQQDAFNLQKQQIGNVNSVAAPYVSAQGQGYTPEQMAYLNSLSANTVNSGYNSATQNVKSLLGARGEGTGSLPVGGPATGAFTALEGMRASDLANAFRNNQLANIQQALSNKFNAASLMAGLAPLYAGNTAAFGNQGLSALGTANNAYQNSFGGNFGSILGSQLGKSAGAWGVGSLGGLLGSLGKNSLSGLYSGGGINLAGADLGTNAALISGLGSLSGGGLGSQVTDYGLGF